MTRLLIFTCAAALIAAPACAQRSGRGDAATLFERADADGDGLVTRAEYIAARNARFDRMDRNHDGVVEKSDFGRLARFRPQAASRLDAIIGQADANHDGRLTRAELAAAPVPIFDRADANHDDRVDKDEIARLRASAQALKDRDF